MFRFFSAPVYISPPPPPPILGRIIYNSQKCLRSSVCTSGAKPDQFYRFSFSRCLFLNQ